MTCAEGWRVSDRWLVRRSDLSLAVSKPVLAHASHHPGATNLDRRDYVFHPAALTPDLRSLPLPFHLVAVEPAGVLNLD